MRSLLRLLARAAASAALAALSAPALEPQAVAELVKDHGNALFAAGRFEDAQECFTRSLALYPRQSASYSNRAAVRLQRG